MDWIREQLEARRWTQGELADRIGMPRNMLTKMLNGHREAKASEVDDIRRAFGYALPEDGRTVPVIGCTRLDGTINVAEPAKVSAVSAPGVACSHLAAAQVCGSAAEPIALDGDVVVWGADALTVSPGDIGRPVVAQTLDGRVLLRRLGGGTKPGVWSLLALNPAMPSDINVPLAWASRILLTIPADTL